MITRAGPTSGHPIAVTVEDGRPVWEPATAVVLVGALTDRPAAQAWAHANRHMAGEILDSADAELLGQAEMSEQRHPVGPERLQHGEGDCGWVSNIVRYIGSS